MSSRILAAHGLILFGTLLSQGGTADAQSPTIEPMGPIQSTTPPGQMRPSLGPSPGAGASPFANSPGGGDEILGGRPGASTPRVPLSTTGTDRGMGLGLPSAIPPPAPLRPADLPAYGSLSLAGEEGDGPADGLTLDAAIELLIRQNGELRSKSYEIPQAQADILTAGLRANPLLYVDSQLIPYGGYSRERPGGPTQYDVNITYPLDLNGKRRARIEVAGRAKRVLEAQFQDAVRLQIGNLYTVFVDVLAARETVRFARASVEGLGRLQEVTEALKESGSRNEVDVDRVRIQRAAAEIGLADAEDSLRRATHSLSTLLGLPAEVGEELSPLGSIRDNADAAPDGETLIQLALCNRPDLIAYRLGVARAESDVKLAHANRFGDVFLLAQPYTFQDNAPFGTKSAHSWAVGMTIPLPIYNRNQGNIERARLNVVQTQSELATLERAVVNEVQQVEREYVVTRLALKRLEGELIPGAARVLSNTEQLYRGGELDLVAFLNAQRDYNEIVRQYRDTLVRHRRSMLGLNTVVGQRILP